jgi:hypothetical protein
MREIELHEILLYTGNLIIKFTQYILNHNEVHATICSRSKRVDKNIQSIGGSLELFSSLCSESAKVDLNLQYIETDNDSEHKNGQLNIFTGKTTHFRG